MSSSSRLASSSLSDGGAGGAAAPLARRPVGRGTSFPSPSLLSASSPSDMSLKLSPLSSNAAPSSPSLDVPSPSLALTWAGSAASSSSLLEASLSSSIAASISS